MNYRFHIREYSSRSYFLCEEAPTGHAVWTIAYEPHNPYIGFNFMRDPYPDSQSILEAVEWLTPKGELCYRVFLEYLIKECL